MIRIIFKIITIVSLVGIPLQVSATLIGEEVTYQRVFQGVSWPSVPEQATFDVTGGVEFVDISYTVNIQSNTIRVEITDPGGSGFGNAPPQVMRFFLPQDILGTSLVSSNFSTISSANVSNTRRVLTVDVNNLTPLPFGAYYEISLNLGGPAKPTPAMSPWSIIITGLGLGLIAAWHKKKQHI